MAARARKSRELNIALAGMMGCGKSAVAAALADLTGLTAIDTDALVEEAAGASIAEIWSAGGEPAFRKLEAAAVEAACRGGGKIVATGGGVVAEESLVMKIRRTAKVVYLRARPATLARRVTSVDSAGEPLSSRPLIAAESERGGRAAVEDELARILQERAPLYEAAADLVVDVDDLDTGEVAAVIERWWSK